MDKDSLFWTEPGKRGCLVPSGCRSLSSKDFIYCLVSSLGLFLKVCEVVFSPQVSGDIIDILCKFKANSVMIWHSYILWMITTIRLVSTSVILCNYCLCECLRVHWEHLRHPLLVTVSFVIHKRVPLTTVILLYIPCPAFIHPVTGGFYPLTNISPFAPPPGHHILFLWALVI